MGYLSTHVLDTSRGKPGAGIKLVVQRLHNDGRRETVSTATTNDDGRCDNPLLEADAFVAGEYEIQFAVGNYFESIMGESTMGESAIDESTTGESTMRENHQSTDSNTAAGLRFLNTVVIRFGVQDSDEHFHVPLLISPFAYSTYRGS